MKTKSEAEKIGTEVLKKLGKSWKYNVWENLGWHVQWIKGAVSLHYSDGMHDDMIGRHFWAMVGKINSGHGHIELTTAECRHFKSPLSAVRYACSAAQKIIEKEWQPIISSIADVVSQLEGKIKE